MRFCLRASNDRFDYYKNLISKFLNKQISIREYEESYNEKFLNEPGDIDDNFFEALDWLFAEIECYTDDEELRQKNPDFSTTEEQVRKTSIETLEFLKKFEIK